MAKQVWKFERTDRRIRTQLNGETIADTTHAMLMIESNYELHYYFPVNDVKMDFLEKSDEIKSSGYKGDAQLWHVKVGDKVAENAAWTYPETKENRPDLSGYIAFQWSAMDAWFEEDEEVFLHPRNPYHRVDAMQSSRHVKVVVGGETIAETSHPHLLFETNLRTRYYIPKEDVRMDLLTHTDTTSICPYKGTAEYWSVKVNGDSYNDIVWSYPDPIPEMPKIKDLVAFWTEKTNDIELYVDGELVE